MSSSLFDPVLFGAVADGVHLDTLPLQQAIDACASAGGGVVRVPPGRYLCTTLHLKSNVTLELVEGARLTGSTDVGAYTAPVSAKWNWNRALILIEGATDVAIVGPGVIDGVHAFDPTGEEKMRGPHTVVLKDATRVRIQGVRFENSANYAVLAYQTDHLTVEHCTFTGGWDGVHVRGRVGHPCKHVTISRCTFETGDDSIAGWYWDDFLITDCVINSSCNGIRVIGPVTRLIVHNTLFVGPGRHPHRTSGRTNMLAGIIIQPGAWDLTQGPTDQVLLSNITMRDVEAPVVVYTKPGNTVGKITVDRLSAFGVYGAPCTFESWAEEPIGHVVLRDVHVEYTPHAARDVVGVTDVTEPRHGTHTVPGWAVYARRVNHLTLDRVTMNAHASEKRQPVVSHPDEGKTDTVSVHDCRFETNLR